MPISWVKLDWLTVAHPYIKVTLRSLKTLPLIRIREVLQFQSFSIGLR